MLFLDEDNRRKLRGLQESWLTTRAAEKPVPKPKPRKLNRDRRRHLVETVAGILARGEWSKFSYEAACRYGLRRAFCRQGWRWIEADATAADIVAAALRSIGAQRPTWKEGQPEWTQDGFAPVLRTRCLRCHKPLEGIQRRFCSALCADGHSGSLARIQMKNEADVYDFIAKGQRKYECNASEP